MSRRCQLTSSLNDAAQLMWEHRCGSVPVVDKHAHVVGIITDRDISMAVYTKGKALSDIPVSSACAHRVHTCQADEALSRAEQTMVRAQVRRLPILNRAGELVDMLSLSDLATHAHSIRLRDRQEGLAGNVALVFEEVSRPRCSFA